MCFHFCAIMITGITYFYSNLHNLEVLMMCNKDKLIIAAAIAKNAKDELGAQEGYIELANLMETLHAPAEHIAKIREIAGDERNHALTELALLAYYDPDTKIAGDGMEAVLETIEKQLDKDE